MSNETEAQEGQTKAQEGQVIQAISFDRMTDKQQMFCIEYLKDLNATQAAIRAGYSERTAKQMGTENLAKPIIAEYIEAKKAERSKAVQIDAEWLLRELTVQYMKAQDADKDSAALRALELIGKHCNVSAFKERLELSGELAMTHEQALRELE